MMHRRCAILNRILVFALTCALAAVAALSVFGVGQASAAEPASASDLSGKKIGMYSNTDPLINADMNNWQVSYIDEPYTLAAALSSYKIDAFLIDRATANAMVSESPDKLKVLEGSAGTVDTGLLFSTAGEGKILLAEFKDFLDKMRESGELERLQQKWFGQGDVGFEALGYEGLEGGNGTVRCVSMSCRPYSIVENGKFSGYEPELLTLFCKAYGYKLVFDVAEWSGMLAGVESGRFDVGMGSIYLHTFDSEAAEASDPTYTCDLVAVARNNVQEEGNFLTFISESFQKNLIVQDRWVSLVKGAGVTLLVSVLAILLGSLLGFGLYMASRGGSKAVLAVARVYSWFIQGMPAVLLLMILYYVVFGSLRISGIIVSILAFGLMLGSGVYNMVRNGVDAIDPGQMQGALALGYTSNQAFFKFVLPQAARIFIPQFRAEVVALVKGTAIVGYIAVVDLTKAGDLIRSNTFDAFFPLVTCAIVYFVIIAIITHLLDFVAEQLDTSHRTEDQILKGIKRERVGG